MLPYTRLDADTSPSDRDLVLLILHAVILLTAILLGLALGRWFGALGFAYAALFFVVVAFATVGAQAGSFELACHGHNDLIRHWTC